MLVVGILVILFFAAVIGILRPYKFAPKLDRRHYSVAAVLAFVLIGVTAPKVAPQAAKSAQPGGAVPPPVPASAAATGSPDIAGDAKPSESEWRYNEQKDEMRGATSRFAELDAQNTINLDFPYGEQRGHIIVRQSPQFGFDLLVGVPSGQIMCNSFSNSRINVKFDDGPIERFGCTDASDGTSNMVFVQNSRGFLAKLKKSGKVVVEAEFFQNGMQQMVFNSAGLKWE